MRPIAAILLFFCTTLAAQPVRHFALYTQKEGLSDNHVQCILRDHQGFLWVGTNNGLNRYDGYSFRVFLPGAGLPGHNISNENILDLAQDKDGFIWIATANGLNRFDPRTEAFKIWKNTGRNNGSLPNSLVRNIYIDQQNKLWLACDNRDLCRFDPTTNTFTSFPWRDFTARVLPQYAHTDYKNINDLMPGPNQDLLLATNLGFFVFDIKNETFRLVAPVPKNLPKYQSEPCQQILFTVQEQQGLLAYNPCNFQWMQIPEPAVTGQITGSFAHQNSHWLLTNNGLWLFNHNKKQLYPVAPATSNDFTAPEGPLNCFFVEKSGLVWLGGERGLWLYEPTAQQFHRQILDTTSTMPGKFIDSKIDGRRYILDTYHNRLLVIDQNRIYKKIPLPNNATALFEDSQGQIWVGSGPDIYILQRPALQLKRIAVPATLLPEAQSNFCDITQDAAGNYWFANDRNGVLVWRPDTGHWWKPSEKEEFISETVTGLLADHQQRTVWLATSDYGLFRYDEAARKFTLYQREENNPEYSLGGYVVNALCKDQQGQIWIATEPGGISKFDYNATDGRQFTNLNISNGLPYNQISAMATDATGNIWAAAPRGLIWINSRSLHIRAFDKDDGLTSGNFGPSLSLAADGAIGSSFPGGYQYFYPDSLLRNTQAERIFFTAFKVFDKNYSDTFHINFIKKITLSWRQNFFSFEFASTFFPASHKNQYAYRLIGFDKNWNDIQGRHTGSYTNVPPGNYTLEIKTGRHGLWFAPAIRLPIRITPPFWATWWFAVLAMAVAAGGAWWIYRRRINQIRREESLKTEFNQRIARTEMAALRAQMNPHFVFNCLNSINRFILINKPEEASDYLTKFSRLIRLILDNSRSDTVLLSKELDALQLYIEMERLRFSEHFDYRIDIASDLQTEHIEIPPLLIQPYVENAIWHGLMHKKERGLLAIEVYAKGKMLCITVQDNGVGRQRAAELKSRSAAGENKSLGMKVTAERLEIVQKLYGAYTDVVTRDLKNEYGEAAGTSVCLTIEY